MTDPAKMRVVMQALALCHKVANGKSVEEMMPVFRQLIDSGTLRLKKVPHQNTFSRWQNDERLIPVLNEILMRTAKPFRAIETAGLVDSSKMSQMRSAHSRWVEYGDDQRESADWMKMHALVGAETLVCMGVEFSGTTGQGTHDINYLLPLVRSVQGKFNLRYVLADKAYLSQDVVNTLWEIGMQAVIPIKKRWGSNDKQTYYEACQHLVEWYDKRQHEFHEIYRVRAKIEGYFSLVKRVTSGYCWSRGRPRKDASGHAVRNADDVCTAWKIETLCKLIYVNLRLTVQYEIATGYRMNYLTDTFFPPLTPDQKIIP